MNEPPCCEVCGREMVVIGVWRHLSGTHGVTMQCPRQCPETEAQRRKREQWQEPRKLEKQR